MSIVNSHGSKINRPSGFFSFPIFVLFGLLALLVGFRLLWLSTSIESLYWPEEIYRGTLTREWLRGFHLGIWDYLADGYDAGGLWIGTLAVPFFKVFGQNLFSLKLVPLFLSALTLTGVWLFALRFFDFRTAVWCSLFFIFSAPVFAGLSLYAIGSQPESPFLVILILGLFYEVLFKKRYPSLIWVGFWGLLCGLAFWFTSINAIVILTCVFSWVWLRPKTLSWKIVGIGLLGFAIGILPQIVFNVSRGGLFVSFLRDSFVSAVSSKSVYPLKSLFIPLRFLRLCLETIPFSFSFLSWKIIPGLALSLLFFLIALRILFPLCSRSARDTEKPLLLFPVLFVLIYAFSNYGTYCGFSSTFYSYRYFTPLYFILILLLGISAAKIRRLWLWSVVLLVLGFAGQAAYFFKDPLGLALRYPGMSYFDLGKIQGPRFLASPSGISELNRLAEKFLLPEKYWFYLGIAESIKDGWLPLNEHALEYLQALPETYRPYFAEGWGTLACDPSRPDFVRLQGFADSLDLRSQKYFWHGVGLNFENESSEGFLKTIQKIPEPYRWMFYRQLGQGLYYGLFYKYADRTLRQAFFSKDALAPDPEKIVATQDLLNKIPFDFRSHVVLGMGIGAGLLGSQQSQNHFPWDPVMILFSEDDKRIFYQGAGFGFRRDNLLNPRRAEEAIKKLPPRFLVDAKRGVAEFESWYGISRL